MKVLCSECVFLKHKKSSSGFNMPKCTHPSVKNHSEYRRKLLIKYKLNPLRGSQPHICLKFEEKSKKTNLEKILGKVKKCFIKRL